MNYEFFSLPTSVFRLLSPVFEFVAGSEFRVNLRTSDFGLLTSVFRLLLHQRNFVGFYQGFNFITNSQLKRIN